MNTAKEVLYADVETDETFTTVNATTAAAAAPAATDPFAEPKPEVAASKAPVITINTATSPAATNSAAAEDVFSAANFAQSDSTTRSIDDLTIQFGPPSDEVFVMVSNNPLHSVTATLLAISREDGYGKSHFLLTPMMRGWLKNQPSLQKFVKDYRLFLYCNQDGEFGLWSVRDSYDNWSVSDLQVVEAAKKVWTRRYNAGKVRKAHTSTSIEFQIEWPEKSMFGPDGILAMVFGEAFVISSPDNPTIKRLLGRS